LYFTIIAEFDAKRKAKKGYAKIRTLPLKILKQPTTRLISFPYNVHVMEGAKIILGGEKYLIVPYHVMSFVQRI
jgi:hypothetical protein